MIHEKLFEMSYYTVTFNKMLYYTFIFDNDELIKDHII